MSNNIINRVKAAQAGYKFPINQEVTLNADGSGGTIYKQTKDDDGWGWSDTGHLALDVLGMIDVWGIGTAADSINAAWYLKEGDKANAAISTAAATPGLGWGATVAKWGKRVNEARKLKNLSKNAAVQGTPNAADMAKKLKDKSDKIMGNLPKNFIKDMGENIKTKFSRSAYGKWTPSWTNPLKTTTKPFERGTFGKIVDWSSLPATWLTETKRDDEKSEYFGLGEADKNFGKFSWGEDKERKKIADSSYKQRFNDGVAFTGRQHWTRFKK